MGERREELSDYKQDCTKLNTEYFQKYGDTGQLESFQIISPLQKLSCRAQTKTFGSATRTNQNYRRGSTSLRAR